MRVNPGFCLSACKSSSHRSWHLCETHLLANSTISCNVMYYPVMTQIYVIHMAQGENAFHQTAVSSKPWRWLSYRGACYFHNESWWGKQVSVKRRPLSTRLQGVTTLKTAIFIFNLKKNSYLPDTSREIMRIAARRLNRFLQLKVEVWSCSGQLIIVCCFLWLSFYWCSLYVISLTLS